MNQWPIVKLGDVCTVVGGGTPKTTVPEYWGGTIPWLTPKDLSGNKNLYVSCGERSITESGLDNSSAALLPKGTVLWSSRAPIGHVAIAETNVATNQGFKSFIPGLNVDSEYLAYTLIFMKDQLQEIGTGATFKEVSAKRAKSIQIPLPPLDEQRRIAQILKLVDFQKHTVSHVLSVTFKSLRTSIFHRVSSGPEVEERRLSEICDLYGGASLPKGIPFDNTKDGLLLMKVSDMNEKGNERHIHSTAVHVPSIPENLPNSIAPAHTVVLPKRGAAIATNKKRLTTRYTMLDPNLIGVRCKTPAVNSTYLYEWFENFDLTTITSGSSIPQLNKKDLNPLLIPIPSTTALQGFTGASSKIDEIEQHVRDKLALLEELHQSLATRAFAGQL
ncbi:restriction endonuclease subunit S [Corynebacterium amycolatum]|uniref:restriction endonuclease subunit S n=1 Tax=Corynebacterium amycolatum TaxID=43765 RepID=UPI003B590064